MNDIYLLIVAVLLRIFSNPWSNVLQKKLSHEGNHPSVINFLSFFLLCGLCLLIGCFVPLSVNSPAQFWTYALMGGVVGAIGNGFLVKAMQSGELSVLGPINAYKAVVGVLLGILLLAEIPNGWALVGIGLIIGGSYFVLNTTAEKFSFALLRNKTIQYRIWALILTAVEAIFVKKVILASSAILAFFCWCGFGAVFSFLLLVAERVAFKQEIKRITQKQWQLYALLVGCIGTMQLTTNYALQHMPVGYALSLFQLSAILSVFLGYRIFKEQDLGKKLLGSVIMLAGAILIIWMK